MKLKPTICPPRHRSNRRAAKIAREFEATLDLATSEHSVQQFLNKYPEVMGWLIGWGTCPTLVCPQFRLGSDFVTDFLVIDAPQWIEVCLVEIESPTATVFNSDGTYAKRLSQAVKQTTDWRQWIMDNRRYLVEKLLEITEEVQKALGRRVPHGLTWNIKERYQDFLTHGIGHGRFRVTTAIVIGRRSHFGDKKEKRRRGFLDSSEDSALFSFDALLDMCRDRFKW